LKRIFSPKCQFFDWAILLSLQQTPLAITHPKVANQANYPISAQSLQVHFEASTQKSFPLVFLACVPFLILARTHPPKRKTKKLFWFPLVLKKWWFLRGHIFANKDLSVWYIANSYDLSAFRW